MKWLLFVILLFALGATRSLPIGLIGVLTLGVAALAMAQLFEKGTELDD